MSGRHRSASRGALRIFAIPAAIAAISLFALIAALLTDGAIDLLWSALAAVPLIVIVLAVFKTPSGANRVRLP